MQEGKNRILMLLQTASVLLVVFVLKGCAQNLPPAKYDGFVYDHHLVDSDSILIEAFFDPVCPDSRDAWPPLKKALQHYSPRVSVVVHLLPLPYHDNAFVSSRVIHIVNQLNTSATFPLLEWFFKNQEKYYNVQTRNLSRVAVADDIVNSVTEVVGNSYHSDLESSLNDRKTDLKTRVSFKYSASRGVYATPTFFLNGFVLPDAGSPTDFNGWKKIIDPLIGNEAPKNQENLHFFL
ncbi:PREDICTED: thioredoxin [Prunus dulcis]|uniref:PREDICTED: thioredoxin n=1 Tax=Prunus dulcis TaxID=3755 RepID=A0A5E4FCV9_PRUDU|nr:uncharacterized protein LOC117613889 [Prunus dulcis]VVA25795.1 PREDICTED: thioredoxin [Prunus dulcis]